MKTLLLFVALCCCINLYAQDTATTTKGVKILVYSDGTWRPFDNSLPAYTRPASSTSNIEFLSGKARLWFNDRLWVYDGKKSEEVDGFSMAKAEYVHACADNGSAIVMICNVVVSESMLQPLILKLISSRSAKEATLLQSQIRLINGLPMYLYEFAAEKDNTPVRGIIVIYVNRTNTVFVCSSIAEKYIDTCRQHIEDFVCGIEIHP